MGLGNSNLTYKELGVDLDASTMSGIMNYYSTRYLIWANDAAKELTGCDFAGEGSDISPCYLMGELFSLLGWDAQQVLPVINDNGFYFENGNAVRDLGSEALSTLEKVDFAQYYLRKNFSYSEVAS